MRLNPEFDVWLLIFSLGVGCCFTFCIFCLVGVPLSGDDTDSRD